MRIDLVLPFPPSLNHAYPSVGRRRVKSTAVRRFEAAAQGALLVWRAQQTEMRDLIPPFRLCLDLYPPDRRRRDASNCCKIVEDAVFSTLGFDDSLVTRIEITKHDPDPKNPRCVVMIEGKAVRMVAAIDPELRESIELMAHGKKYGVFFVTGEGDLLPNGREASSGSIVLEDGRHFSFWERAVDGTTFLDWEEESVGPATLKMWMQSSEYRFARTQAGLPYVAI